MISLFKYIYPQRIYFHYRRYSVLQPPESWFQSLGITKNQIPQYDKPINIQIKAYDFVVLEKFQSKLHSLIKSLNLSIKDVHGTPANTSKVVAYKKRSKLPENYYTLNKYERNIVINNMPSLNLPILFEIFSTILPEGVNLNINYYTEVEEEYLYIQDSELQTLKTGLEMMNREEEEKMNETLVKKRLKEESKILKNLSKML